MKTIELNADELPMRVRFVDRDQVRYYVLLCTKSENLRENKILGLYPIVRAGSPKQNPHR